MLISLLGIFYWHQSKYLKWEMRKGIIKKNKQKHVNSLAQLIKDMQKNCAIIQDWAGFTDKQVLTGCWFLKIATKSLFIRKKTFTTCRPYFIYEEHLTLSIILKNSGGRFVMNCWKLLVLFSCKHHYKVSNGLMWY